MGRVLAILLIIGIIIAAAGPVATSFREARERTSVATERAQRTQPTTQVTFTSDPTGATVRIAGTVAGRTPVTAPVPLNREVRYSVTPDEPYEDFDLYKPHEGVLTASEPVAIDVWIDRTTAEEQTRQRAAAVEARAAAEQRERERRAANAHLILEDWGWTRDQRLQSIQFEGQVTNNTPNTLRFVQALVEFYTADGQFISSRQTYLTITDLLPGQTSPFRGFGTWNPAAQNASIRFTMSGRALNVIRRSDVP